VLAHTFLHAHGVNNFWEDFVLTGSELWRHKGRMGRVSAPMCGPSRPFITWVEQHCCLHHYGQWVPCENVIDAILKLLFILLVEYKGLLADDTSVLTLCQQFHT